MIFLLLAMLLGTTTYDLPVTVQSKLPTGEIVSAGSSFKLEVTEPIPQISVRCGTTNANPVPGSVVLCWAIVENKGSVAIYNAEVSLPFVPGSLLGAIRLNGLEPYGGKIYLQEHSLSGIPHFDTLVAEIPVKGSVKAEWSFTLPKAYKEE